MAEQLQGLRAVLGTQDAKACALEQFQVQLAHRRRVIGYQNRSGVGRGVGHVLFLYRLPLGGS
jgi:hypothetical protein